MSFTSSPITLPLAQAGSEFARADLRFLDIDHSGDTFEGRIFFNTPDANTSTPTDESSGYAGSLYIFGHRHCWGDAGHCSVPPGPLHGFDDREPHHLVPQIHEVDVTDAIRRLLDSDTTTATVTVVPIVRAGEILTIADDQLSFSELQLVTYE